ncbi:MAG: hypothetical protein ACOY4H_10970 [Thermodesulfobacteriota bacterium]
MPLRTLLLVLPFLALCACTRHEIDSRHDVQVAPVEIKPIHITIDVNIKVDKALDNFFDDIDKAQP